MADISALQGFRVLLVEDEMLVSLALQDTLSDFGCAVVGPYHNLELALHAAQHEQIDFGLIDIDLRGCSSFPVADVLTERQVPFVFLSGYGDSVLPPNRPDWRIVQKPIREAELSALIAKQLRASPKG